MKQIKLSDIELIVDSESAYRQKMSDEEYFTKYKDYLSNSGIKWINPDQGGSPKVFFEETHKFTTSSLQLGSAVHEAILQPECFHLAKKIDKPTSKLGQVCDLVIKYRKENLSIYDSIVAACKEVPYYNKNDQYLKKISEIIRKGYKYYINARNYDDSIITLDNKSWDTATNCIRNLKRDKQIMSLLEPEDFFGDKLDTFNEDAIFMDVIAKYSNNAIRLKIKGKLDNWNIDLQAKKVIVNDLKTTGHFVSKFTQPDGSLYFYHYTRQAALYMDMLTEVMKKEYGFNKDWSIYFNFLVVSTIGFNETKTVYVSNKDIIAGREEYKRLLKMIAYYKIFGYKEEVEFI